ncbi:hypothetical protein HPO96_37105 [Kribbella sandramycini]|uniref:Uncharacterized protein n=1 Tax=Kribbella sandramycini TaxID=60450 RepID=A0A7Y4L7L5_9ACTN|nr:hypothetical protein [Kribbella sandramycini]MBB6564418.1 hypothetical protein [Kribbella sandramycini]NOL45879.1 hypothetical protein [Kribbella sandramycini]
MKRSEVYKGVDIIIARTYDEAADARTALAAAGIRVDQCFSPGATRDLQGMRVRRIYVAPGVPDEAPVLLHAIRSMLAMRSPNVYTDAAVIFLEKPQ